MSTPDRLEIRPVTGLGEITEGADLPALLAGAAPWLADGDVLVVTSKIISKAEGRLVPLPPDGPGREAAREAILDAETARPVARRGPTRIVQTRHGFVLASAGIDASNVDAAHLVLLPVDPDGSARRLRAGLRERFGLDVAVVVTDTMGRPWRLGLTDVAIGAAGVPPLRDHRGEKDAHGKPLYLTQMAVIDELAAAAELVKGKHDQVPVAVVRGLSGWVTGPHFAGAAVLVRGAEADLFSLGTAEARAEGLRRAAALGGPARGGPAQDGPAQDGPAAAALPAFSGRAVDDATLARALDDVGGDLTLVEADDPMPVDAGGPAGVRVLLPCAAPDPLSAAAAGARVHALRAACAAAGLATAWLSTAPESAGVPEGLVPLGTLLIGWPADPS